MQKKKLLLSIFTGLSSSLITSVLMLHIDINAGLAAFLGAFATASVVAIYLVFTDK
jgi:uncharacterized membrane protein YjjB (DUF3815 family)